MSRSIVVHLVRHGESLWNVEGRYQGQQDSGLTADGRAQVAQFGEEFAREVPDPDVVVSSDLPRVRDTAQQYIGRVGAPVSYDAALREMSVGDWAGMTLEDAERRHPEIVSAVAAGEDLRRGGGETFAETRDRVAEAIERVIAELETGEGDRVGVVFTSGNPIRLAAAHMLGIPSPGHMALGAPDNCSVTTFRLRDGRREVVRYNHDIAPARPADQREIS
ncbi:broad specificity phosphatase PhoE [Microbacterium sp. W4I4]|uniref:histidine phosphatase family protein n=1 Tax=Microbacterium sp. W4I4 TaxID=3042295 RepID=UPI00278B098A|nr:histidine phosphatase family protein [Microbacterium sp. W4I4]MDQ0614435.1 broad specificity phosphatase PhoE [Microbacterium sp. W4I4]